MRRWLYRLHIIIGVCVSLPLLSWATSGLVSLWPSASTTIARVEPIRSDQIRVSPAEALRQANGLAGHNLPITALTLTMREGEPVYQAIGGLGSGSILVNAATGTASLAPPSASASRFFSQAHFFYFTRSLQVPLMVVGCLLACAAALTGLWLALRKARIKFSR